MNIQETQGAVEAILFAAGEPLEPDKIAAALLLDKETVIRLIRRLADDYEEAQRGICILELDGKYQMASRLQYAQQIRQVLEIKRNTPLSPAAFEVLAVVAYNQPVTKAFADQVRGVDCGGVINSLCQKGLIEEKGRLDLPGRPLVYGTTDDFLRCFCLRSLEELPPLPQKEEKLSEESSDGEEITLLMQAQLQQ